MSTKAKTESDLIEAAEVGSAGGVRSEPESGESGAACQPAPSLAGLRSCRWRVREWPSPTR